MILALAAVLTATHPWSLSLLSSPPTRPRWFADRLAGHKADFLGALYDPKTGWFLMSTSECDGEFTTFILTQDRATMKENGFRVNPPVQKLDGEMYSIKFAPIANLTADNGVRIGWSIGQVKRGLGTPTKVEREGKHGLSLRYTWNARQRPLRRRYDQIYTFSDGKLKEIILSSASLDD